MSRRQNTTFAVQPASARIAMASLVGAMAMVGANVPFGKVITAEIPVVAFIVLRFAVASLLLLALARHEPGPGIAVLTPRHWGAVLMLGLVGSILFTFFMLEGVARTSGIDAGIITASLPAVVALLGVAIGERPRRREIAMIALAVAGVAVIQTGGAGGGVSTFVGNVAIGLAVVCEAIAVLSSRPLASVLRPLRLSLVVAVVSLVCCLPFAYAALTAFDWSRVAPGTWLLFLWYIAASSILATVLWYRGIPHVPPWRAGLATAALPVAAMVVSALFLGEGISVYQVAGAALVISAILAGTLLATPARPETRHDASQHDASQHDDSQPDNSQH